jgi:hypothetical protein
MTRHLTEDQICRAIAGQSTLDEGQHANACAECRSEIARSQYVIASLRHGIVMRAEREGMQSAPSLRARTNGKEARAWAFAAVSMAAVVSALIWQARLAPPPRPSADTHRPLASGHAGTASVAVDAVDEFYPLAYSTVPVTNGRIIRIEVPRSAPVAFGLDPIDFVRTRRNAVLADVVVGEDGLARAVRFVRPLRDDVQKD